MIELPSCCDTEAIHAAATSEATYLCKLLDDLLTKLFALGDNHTATDGLLELAGWVTYGLTHITDKVVRVGLEPRSSDDSIEDHDELIDNINNVLKVAKQKWNVEPSNSNIFTCFSCNRNFTHVTCCS